MGFSGGPDGKESACNVGDLDSNPGLGRSPGVGNGNPLQYSFLENPHGQRSLAAYSPWSHKESATTERLSIAQHTHTHTHTHTYIYCHTMYTFKYRYRYICLCIYIYIYSIYFSTSLHTPPQYIYNLTLFSILD